VITNKKNIIYIDWPIPKVLAFSTTRLPLSNQATSKSPLHIRPNITNTVNTQSEFDYFNLGNHVGDCPKTVLRNRTSLLNYLPVNAKVQWLEQVHGSHVAEVIKHDKSPIVADAVITRSRNVALAIMTADCLPILLSNSEGSEIAAIHAGWRPLAANIILNTLSKMTAENKDIHAWLGPCIGRSNFEVGAEVRQVFCALSQKLSRFFITSTGDKYHADLSGLARHLLEMAGVVSITHHQECTFADKDKFYSYRREYKTGRMASIICLEK